MRGGLSVQHTFKLAFRVLPFQTDPDIADPLTIRHVVISNRTKLSDWTPRRK
jgi:hypothetical protein